LALDAEAKITTGNDAWISAATSFLYLTRNPKRAGEEERTPELVRAWTEGLVLGGDEVAVLVSR
jgi:hypothetical protein